MNKVMMLERAVLESIGAGNKTAQRISDDIGLTLTWVKSILFQLQSKGVIGFDGYSYSFMNKEKLSEINSEDNVKYEIKEITNSMIESYFAKNPKVGMKLQKVNMTDSEAEIFKTMLQNLENFISDLRTRKRQSKTSNQQVIFWGSTTYQSLLGDFIRNNC
ncbi:hypothetical protein M899_1460 [Bacteriovorax sp. BSW11_IV]|uniref:hypothetical protein n=1 Tax=Bacteriovorax sp. BSW11_IV TaxID=1353529 RepID=UPI00038A3311|nr:hypothetical protein [Bacteriovorax sp. BSW11_IV]EQC48375.1 hypothetical protein M899_1460 [Bacteriovorax sp. BSW11_IV]